VTTRMRAVSALAVACLVVVAARPARAQAWHFGPQIDWANDYDFGIGARAEFDLASSMPTAKNFGIIGSFDYFFPGFSVNPWEINIDGAYRFSIPNAPIFPYAGAGLDFTHWGVSSGGFSYSYNKVGLNLMAGSKFQKLGTLTPYAELRLELRTGGQFVLTGGVLF
jgi:outer membrane protein with beta-barrel domain